MTLQCLVRALSRAKVSLARGPHRSPVLGALSRITAYALDRRAVLQGIALGSALIIALGASALWNDADAALVCAAPGRDNPALSGIINSYWGGASAVNNATNATVTLGNQRTGTSNTPNGVASIPSTAITAGDLLIIMQMQGANAGAYEYVTAVAVAGNAITVRGTGTNGNLIHAYTQSFSSGNTFQVIRVPQALNLSLGNYSAPTWDIDAAGYGTGGVFAVDVAQQATLTGTINVTGQGFRGGAGFNLAGNATAASGINSSSTSYPSATGTGASKGEGTAGTPGYVFDGYAFTYKQYNTTGLTNAAYTAATPTGAFEGNYTAGSFGFGAMGNAGGGGNDASPTTGNNQYNSGGAGGGSAGRGGQGGWTWLGNSAYCSAVGYTPTACPFVTNEGITDGGGRGGMAVGGLSASMVVLGGGGGAASLNNNGSASSISSYPPVDVAVDPTTLSGGSTTVGNGATGPVSGAGARGGGIVLIRAGTFNSAAGQILANGVRAYNQFGNAASEAAGGGGGGGSIVVLAQAASGTLSASAAGGRGGDPDYYAHGPGGGGGGGYILTNFSVNGTVDKGGSGYVPAIGTYPANFPFPNHYGTDAVDGIAGYLSTAGGTTPGTSSGSACSPDVAATVTLPASAGIGATVPGSFTYTDNGPADASSQLGYSATLSPGLTGFAFTNVKLNGVVVAGATAAYNPTTGVITYTGMPTTIPNGQSVVVAFTFTMPASGNSVTGTDAITESVTDPVPANNTGTATVNGTPQDDDATTITGLPATDPPGTTPINGIVNFTNNGPSASNGTTYSIKLPVGSTVSSVTYNGTAITGLTSTVGPDGTVTFSGTGSLPTTLNPGDVVAVSFSTSMPANGSSIAATSSIASATTDSNTSNNTASAIVTGQGSADLKTTITVPTTAQQAGTPFTGSVTFQDAGPGTGATPVYTLQVPPGSSITAGQVLLNGTPIAGVTVTIDQYGNVTFGGTGLPTSLANGDTVTVGFNSTMPADGSNATVVSSISSPTTDPNLTNNNATATVTGIREADLQSTVTGYATFAQTAGTSESGTITFADNGPSGATGVTYTSTIAGSPAAANVVLGTPTLNGVAITGATATYNSTTGAITYTGLPTTLNSGDKITVSVTFVMPGNPVTVSSNITSNTADPIPSNNAGSQTLNGGNDLAVTLTNWPTAAQAAGTAETSTVTYSIVSGSAVAGTAWMPSLTLSPGLTGVTITGPAGTTATYAPATGIVTFSGLPTLSTAGTASAAFTVKYNMPTPAANVVAQASITETPNIDTYAGNNSATATVPGTGAMTDMATTITGMGGVAAASSTVTAAINFTNLTGTTSTGDSFAAKLPVGATVTSITLNGVAIPGATGTVGSDGTVTFAGMPVTVAGAGVVAVNFTFPMPANGSPATATATITSSNDSAAGNNTATATETSDAPTDLQTKITQPVNGAANATLNGTLHFLNNGPSAAINPTYQMTLPVAGGTPTISSVMLNGSLLSVTTSISATGVVTFTGMPTTLSAGDDLVVAYTYKTPASGQVTTTGQITYPGTDTVPANNAATAVTNVVANAPNVMVTKTVDHTIHAASSVVNWTLTATNSGNSPTTGVVTLTDTLPANITGVTVTPSAGTTCTPAAPVAGTTLNCSVPAGLAAASSATVGISATLAASAGTYNNSVTPSGNATDNPTCAPNACSTVTVVGSATMQVTKKSINGTGTFNYALTNMSAGSDSITTTAPNNVTQGVINVVSALGTAITITETAPVGYVVTSASCVDTNAASGDGNPTTAFGSLSGNVLTVPAANVVQNASLVCGFVNTITETISIAKTGPAAMMVGTPASYAITVTNTSAAAIVSTATVEDQLPAGFTFNSGTGNGWTCSAAGQLVTCNFAGSIAAKGSSVITLVATPTATATGVINYATVDPTGSNAPAAPNGCTVSSTCAQSSAANVTGGGLTIAKSAPTPALQMGTQSTYTLTVTNNGTAAATAATIKDQLPAQLTLVSATGTNWTCSNASGLITCTYANATGIAAGGTSTIAVKVQPASDAVTGSSLTNYASIDPTGGAAPPTPGASCTPATSCASQTSTVTGSNVMVTKTVDSATHSVGDTITWTIRVANTGAAATTGAITLTDTLPTGVSNIVATPTAGFACLPAAPVAGGTLTCTLPATSPLAANTGVATVTITATATTVGNVTNSTTASGPDTPTCAVGACTATTVVGGQSLTLVKALNGPRAANSDQFTVEILNGATVVSSATTTGTGNTVGNASTGETAVAAGTAYTLTEVAAGTTVLANYGKTLACTNAATGSATVLPTAVGGTVTPAAGDRITCTLTNSAQPVVTLVKALGGSRVHDTDEFTVQISHGATVVGSATTTGSGATVNNGSTGAVLLTSGTAYTLGEVIAAGSGTQLAQYTSALACSNAATGSATVLPTTVGGTLTPANGDNITCTLTNSPKPPVLTLLGTLTGTRAANTDQFAFTIAAGTTTTATTTTTGTGGTLSNATTGATTVAPGTTYSLTEAAAGTTNLAEYTSVLSCTNTDASSTTVLPTTLPGTVVPNSGDNITCTIAITPKAPVVTLLKALGTAREAAGDQFTIQINNGATTVATATTTGTGATVANNTTGATPLVTGTTYTLTEVAAGTTNLTHYTQALACSNTLTGSTTVLPTTAPGSLTPGDGDNITCTLTNSGQAILTTTKTLKTVNGVAPGTTVKGGDVLVYQLAVVNTGVASGSTTVGETVPVGTVYSGVVAEGWGGTCTTAGTTCSQVTTVAANSTVDDTFTVTVLEPTTTAAIANTATSSSGTCATCSVSINTAQADLSTTVGLTANANAGTTVTATVNFANGGPSTSGTITYVTTLPTGLTPAQVNVTGTGITGTYNAATGAITYTGLPTTLASGAAAPVITITYIQPASATSTVTTSISSTVTDPNTANNAASATTTGNPSADLSSTTSITAGVNAGATVTATVNFANGGPSTSSALTYTTQLPTGLNPTDVVVTGPAGVTGTYNATTGLITYTGLPTTLASGVTEGPITIAYPQPASGTSTVTDNIQEAGPTVDPVTTNNQSSATSTGVPVADLSSTTTVTPGVNAGGTVTATIGFSNAGPSTSGTLTYTTTLPTGLTPAQVVVAGVGITGTYNAATGAITYTGLPTTLAAGASAPAITITYVQPASGTSTVTDNIQEAGPTVDPVTTNNQSSATSTGVPVADLASTTAVTAAVNAGGTVTATIGFTNLGPSTSGTLTYTTTLPTGLTPAQVVVSGTGITGTYNAATGAITYTGLPTTLLAGASAPAITITYVQPASATSTVTDNIQEAGPTTDPVTTNNQSSATSTGVPMADLSSSTGVTAAVNAGGTVTATIGFSNAGPSTSGTLTYTTTLPTGLTPAQVVVSGTGITGTYNATTGAITYTGLPATLAAGASTPTITITYIQPGSGTSTVTDNIQEAGPVTDPVTTNNQSSATSTGVPVADVSSTTTVTAGVNAGGTVTATINFANAGPSTSGTLTYTTQLPTGLNPTNVVVTGPAGVTGSYNATTGLITYTGLPATLASGVTEGPITITYPQPATGMSTVTDNIQEAGPTTDPVTTNNQSTATSTGVPVADLSSTTTVTAGVNAGGTVTATINFANAGPSTSGTLTYTTTLPTGLTPAQVNVTGTGITGTYNAATGAITYTGLSATLASGASTPTITITYIQPGTGTSTVTDNIQEAGPTTDPVTTNNQSSATSTGVPVADVSSTTTVTAGVNAGGTVTATINFANAGPSTSGTLTYTTQLPTGLNPTNVVVTGPAGVTGTYNATSGLITYTGLPTTLASGVTEGPITITYPQPATGTSTVTDNIQEAGPTTDPATGNNLSSATSAGVPVADLASTTSLTPAVNAGGTVTATIGFSNAGPSTSGTLTYTTNLPVGLTPAQVNVSGTGITGTYNAATGVITYTGLPTTLASGASTPTITITYIQPASATSTVTDNIAEAGPTVDPVGANNLSTATSTGNPAADLSSTTAITGTVNVGQTVTATVNFSNAGPDASGALTYTTTLPTGLTPAQVTVTGTGITGTYNAATGAITYTGLPTNLAVGASTPTITITYLQPLSGTSTVSDNITEAGPTVDPVAGNNASSATSTGAPSADLSSTTASTAGVNAGATVTTTVNFSNAGPSPSGTLTYTTTLPTGLTPAQVTVTGAGVTGTYNATTGLITYTGLPTTLASGASAPTITITYVQPASATSTVTDNIAEAGPTVDPNTANNASSATSTGNPSADLSSTTALTAGVNAGGTVTATIGFANAGPSTSGTLTYTTTLPTGLTPAQVVVSGTGITGTYNAATGAITYTGLPATLASGASAPTITITYVQPASGTSSVTDNITEAGPTVDPVTTNNLSNATSAGVPVADVSSTTTVTPGVNAGGTVTATINFANGGPSTSGTLTYTTQLPTGLNPTNVVVTAPAGVTGTYSATTGLITYTGLPTTLASGATEGPITITYPQPTTGTSTVTDNIQEAGPTTDPVTTNNQSSGTSTGVPVADLSSSTSVTAGVNAGGTVTATINFANAGPSTSGTLTYTTQLPTGLNPTNVVVTAPAGVTGSYNATTGLITYVGLPTTLASGATEGPITITYPQPPSGTSTVTDNITEAGPTTDPVTTNNQSSATSTGVPVADVSSTTTVTAGVNAGGTVTATINFANAGPSTSGTLTYTTQLPTGLNPTNVVVTGPAGVTGSYNATTGLITYAGLPTTLASGATEGPITITYPQPATGTSTVTNNITEAGPTTDPVTTNNQSTATSTGVPVADLSSTTTVTAGVNAGGTVTATINFANAGPSTSGTLTYTTTLPTGLTPAQVVVSGTGITGTYNAATGAITYTGLPATLASGASAPTITITYIQPGTGTSTVTDNIQEAGPTTDPVTTNNQSSGTSTGVPVADLSSTTGVTAAVNAGGTVTATINFSNAGPSTSGTLTYTTTLPTGLTPAQVVVSGTGVTGTYNAATGAITYTGLPATLASGASAPTITITYVQPGSATSTVTDNITEAGPTTDPVTTNNQSSATSTGTPVADVSSTTTVTAGVNAGGTVTATINFANAGPSTSGTLTYTTQLPTGLNPTNVVVTAPAGVTGTYSATTGLITYTGLPTTLASGATEGPITITYPQPATGTSTVTNNITEAGPTTDPVTTNNQSTATSTGVPVADLSSTTTVTPGVNAGATVTATINFANAGPSTSGTLTYTTQLPTGLNPTNVVVTGPAGVTGTYNATTGLITYVGLPTTLAAGASEGPITITYPQPATGTSTVTDNISEAGPTTDPVTTNNQSSGTSTGVPVADLSSSTGITAGVNAGGTVTATINFANAGPSTSGTLTYTTQLPTGLNPTSVVVTGPAGVTGTYNATTGLITYAGLPTTLASGATEGPITITYPQPASGVSTVTDNIQEAGPTTDPVTTNNQSSATSTGAPVADVSSTTTVTAGVNAGGTVTATINFANAGPSTSGALTYTTQLPTGLNPANVVVTGPAGVTGTYSPTTGLITYTGLPTTLGSGVSEGPITITYPQPASGTSTVTNNIAEAGPAVDPVTTNNFSTATSAGVPVADLSSSTTVTPGVNAGGTVTATIGFTNAGPSTSGTLTYSTNLPTGLTPAQVVVSGAGITGTYNAGTGAITYTGLPATLASGASAPTITITYVQPASGASTVTDNIQEAGPTIDPVTTNNPSSATSTGVPVADLSSTTGVTAGVNAGGTVTATIGFTNAGPSTSGTLTYTTTLPTGLTPAQVVVSGAGITGTYNAGTGAITYTGLPATLAAGTSAPTITITYVQPASGASSVTDNILEAGPTTDPVTTNNQSSATSTGAPVADLSSTTAATPGVNAGGSVTATINFTNAGPSTSGTLTYTTTLPTGLTPAQVVVTGTGITGTYNAGTGAITYTGLPATLASGASAPTITITYVQPASGASTVSDNISEAGPVVDPNTANNASSALSTGNPTADLSSTTSLTAGVNAGSPVTATINFTNAGPSPSGTLTYTTTLPTGLNPASVVVTGPGGVTGTYNPATGVITYTGLPTTLASGVTEGPITITYPQPASGTSTVTNNVSEAGPTLDPNTANNQSTATSTGVPVADVSSTTTTTTPAANAGSTVSTTVTFANAGPSPSGTLTYTTTLPIGLTPAQVTVTGTGITGTYNPATGVVTYTGLPTTLASGATTGPITITYVQPATGTSTVANNITETGPTIDPNTANNASSVSIAGTPEADLSATLNFPTNVAGLQPVSGTVTFANAGPSPASGVNYTLQLTPNLAGGVTFTNLPPGVAATYNPTTGVVTFTGLPTTLAAGQSVGPIGIAYTQPGSGASTVTGTVNSTTVPDPNTSNNTATSNIVGTAANADLAIQTSAPATVAPNGALIYTLTITNNGPGAANNATFTDTLPAVVGTATASCAPLSGGATCGTVNVAGHTVSGTLGVLPVGATVVITITTTAPASGTFTDTATVAPPAGVTDPVLANNTSSVTTFVGAIPNNVDLSVTTSGTTTVQVGGAVSYVVDVVNGGPAAANNAVFNYVAAAPITAVTWTCQAVGGGAVCPAAAGTGNTINQTIATFPDGGHLLYTISGTAPAAPQQFNNTATVAAPAGETDTNPANNTATSQTNVTAAAPTSADIAVTLNGPSTVQPSAPVVYTVVVTNNGPGSGNGTTLSAPVPTVVTGVTTTCVASGGAVCPTIPPGNNVAPVIPTLPPGGELIFTISGTAPTSGTFSESATVTPATGTNDPVPSNNTAGPIVTTVPVFNADLSIQKNGPAQVLANGIVNYSITISNAGPNSADGATITDVLPAALTNVTAVCSGATGGAVCAAPTITAGTLRGVASSMPSGGSITVTVTGKAPATGTLSNSASVAPPPGVTDPNMTNNTAGPVQTAVVASVPNQADLSASITGPSVVAPNGTVTYVITITNAGPAAGDGAPVTDVLPAGLTNIHATCGNAIGGANCGPVSVNGSTVASTIANLPVGASLTLTVTATAPASGTFSNSASVGAAPGETDPNTANNVAGPIITTIGTATGVANLGISKTGPALVGAGSDFSYSIIVSNAGPGAANGALVSDSVPTGLTNIRATCGNATNGAVCGPVVVTGQNVTSSVTTLPALGSVTLTITVTTPVTTGLTPMTVVNRATVTPPPGVADPDTSDNVSGAVETQIVSAGVSGTVWLDLNHDRKLDAGDPLLPGWIVELYLNGTLVKTATTNAQGQYSITGVQPGPGYSIDFRDPGSHAVYGTPTNGEQGVPNPDSNAVIGNGVIMSITLKPGINIIQQSLPVDPSGVVYDATSRTAVGGATVTLVGPAGFNPATMLVGGTGNVSQVTQGNGPVAGAYQFLLINPGMPGGAPTGTYTISVTPAAGYLAPPAKTGGVSAPGGTFTVPGPINATTPIQPQVGPPPVGDNGSGTIYYFALTFNTGSGAVINNNIPLDRVSGGGALVVTKTGDTATADIGETVLYTIDVTSSVGSLPAVTLTDTLPRGFTLIPNTTTVDGKRVADPKITGNGAMTLLLGTIPASGTTEIKYRVRVGVGAQQGDGVNRAQASDPLGATSNLATYKVNVNGGVFTTDACVIGKVFIDCNGNQIQDENEIGIPGVRLYFSDGTFVVTDSEGKYSYCGLRPTTHTLKVDKSTLPAGSILVESSNRNALDPNSLFIDLTPGELHQADFIEGSCSPQVMDATKARRAQGEVNVPGKPNLPSGPALIFDSKPSTIKPAAPQAPALDAKPNGAAQ